MDVRDTQIFSLKIIFSPKKKLKYSKEPICFKKNE